MRNAYAYTPFNGKMLKTYKNKKEKEPFEFYKAVCIYVLGGLVGTLWETILNFGRGRGFVYCNGSILTPFNFVYGTGGLVIIALLRNRTEPREVFLMGTVGGGIAEYILSFLEERILGTRSWNYDGRLLNVNGRTTVIYMMFWGLLCVGVIFILYRPLNRFLERLPKKAVRTAAAVLAAIIAIDFFVTASALFRYTARHAGRSAFTRLGKLVDKVFTDSFMKKRFPAMRF